ncbi:hypothetical protein LSAT2_023230 [Lamellibrachia satsuma]|nr:hypothetical protein LSAT2_023230 [Lamellibrachia satsuma]
MEGEECDESPNASPRKLCQYSLKCVNKTCRCDEGKKEVTLKYLDSSGVKVTTVVCVNDKVTLGVSVNGECTRMKSNYLNIDETDKICDDYLTCYICEGKLSTLTNSARCLSGPTLVSQSAGHLVVNVMVMFGLLVSVLLFTLC